MTISNGTAIPSRTGRPATRTKVAQPNLGQRLKLLPEKQRAKMLMAIERIAPIFGLESSGVFGSMTGAGLQNFTRPQSQARKFVAFCGVAFFGLSLVAMANFLGVKEQLIIKDLQETKTFFGHRPTNLAESNLINALTKLDTEFGLDFAGAVSKISSVVAAHRSLRRAKAHTAPPIWQINARARIDQLENPSSGDPQFDKLMDIVAEIARVTRKELVRGSGVASSKVTVGRKLLAYCAHHYLGLSLRELRGLMRRDPLVVQFYSANVSGIEALVADVHRKMFEADLLPS